MILGASFYLSGLFSLHTAGVTILHGVGGAVLKGKASEVVSRVQGVAHIGGLPESGVSRGVVFIYSVYLETLVALWITCESSP